MQIELNGDRYQLDDGATVSTLIERLSLNGRRLAVEVNQEVIPKSLHRDHSLSEGDCVEIVHAIGGG